MSTASACTRRFCPHSRSSARAGSRRSVLAQAGLPLLRLGYAEDGGELGRAGGVAAVALVLAFGGSAATYVVRLPPVVHLSAGVHQGPLVIDRREVLQGEPGAVVRGGIVVAHDDVEIRNVTVVGGENGISVDGVSGTVIDGVTVQGAKLDGIHVRLAGVVIRNCTVDMLGNRLGQGIDISFNMDKGMSMVEGCTVVGGQQGITTHSSATDIMDNTVSRTTGQAIAVDEMSMGMASHNAIRNALGVGLYCGDRSMCMFDHNTVIGMRPDTTSGLRNRRGLAVLADFQSEADLWRNRLVANAVAMDTTTNAILRTIVPAQLVSAAYNYERFDAYVESGEDEREFGAFPNMLHAGDRAPDGELTLLDGDRVRLSELWSRQGVVLEFGSFT